MVMSLLLLYSMGASAAPATTRSVAPDPPVRVWFNSDGNYQYGDRAKVYAKAAEDGNLVVLRADAGQRGSLRLRRRDLHGVTGAALRRVGASVRMGRLVGPLVPRVLVRAEGGCRLPVRRAVLRSTGLAPLIA